jgi:hypothetical protein
MTSDSDEGMTHGGGEEGVEDGERGGGALWGGGPIQDKGKGKVEVDMQDPHVSVCGEGELKIAIGN